MTMLPFDDDQVSLDGENGQDQPTQDDSATTSPPDQSNTQADATASPGTDAEQPPTESKRKRRSRAEMAALRAAEAAEATPPPEPNPSTTTNVNVNLSPLTGESVVTAINEVAKQPIPIVGTIDNSADAWEKLADSQAKEKAARAADRKARRRFAQAYGQLTQAAKAVASSWPSNPRAFFEGFAKLCDQVEAEAQAKGVKVDSVFDLLMTLMPKSTIHSLYQIAYTKDTATT